MRTAGRFRAPRCRSSPFSEVDRLSTNVRTFKKSTPYKHANIPDENDHLTLAMQKRTRCKCPSVAKRQ